jgi:restriction endonuclease Mrr
MAIPDFQTVMLPFLETLQDGQERTMRDLTDLLAARFKLTARNTRNTLRAVPSRSSTTA